MSLQNINNMEDLQLEMFISTRLHKPKRQPILLSGSIFIDFPSLDPLCNHIFIYKQFITTAKCQEPWWYFMFNFKAWAYLNPRIKIFARYTAMQVTFKMSTYPSKSSESLIVKWRKRQVSIHDGCQLVGNLRRVIVEAKYTK